MRLSNVYILGAKRSIIALRMRCTMWTSELLKLESKGMSRIFFVRDEKGQAGKAAQQEWQPMSRNVHADLDNCH